MARRLPRGAHLVPGLVRQPLDVVGQVAGELDDGRAQAGLGRDARAREPRVDGRGEFVGGNLVEPHDGAGLVERPLRRRASRSIRLGSDPAKT